MVSQELREYFVGIIAKTNGPKLTDRFRLLSLWNENNMGGVKIPRALRPTHKVVEKTFNLLLNSIHYKWKNI